MTPKNNTSLHDPPPERYEIILQPLPSDPLNRPGDQRIRGALKVLLRGFSLRCEKVRQIDEASQ